MHTVAAVVMNGVHPFELGVACEVFGLERPELGVEWYRFIVCAAEPPPLRTTGAGLLLWPEHTLADLATADTVVFTHWPDPALPLPPDLLAAVRAADHRGARFVSICSGVFVLAAAGLLDGQRATCHWKDAEALARCYPKVTVDPQVLYVDNGRVLTSAGTAAGIDLCLHLVRRDYGATVAHQVARRMVAAPHRDGGQAQFIERPLPAAVGPDPVDSALTWALGHLAEPVSIAALAARAGVSARTFARQVVSRHGITPHQWLLGQRLLEARRLLECTDQPVEAIAAATGFGSPAALRPHFRRRFGTSPTAYRTAYRG